MIPGDVGMLSLLEVGKSCVVQQRKVHTRSVPPGPEVAITHTPVHEHRQMLSHGRSGALYSSGKDYEKQALYMPCAARGSQSPCVARSSGDETFLLHTTNGVVEGLHSGIDNLGRMGRRDEPSGTHQVHAVQ